MLQEIALAGAGFYIFYRLFWRISGCDSYQPTVLPKVKDLDLKKATFRPNKPATVPPLYGKAVEYSRKISTSWFGLNFVLPKACEQYALSEFRQLKFPDRQTHDPVIPRKCWTEKDKSLGAHDGVEATKNLTVFYQQVLRKCDNSRINKLLTRYLSKETTPTQVGRAIIEFIKDDPTNAMVQHIPAWIERQAGHSTMRYENGSNRPLEGVPFAVKEMCHLPNFYRRGGIPDSQPQSKEMTEIVQKLLDQGAICIGMTNVHQLGIGVTGVNTSKGYRGGALNPYSLEHYPGGSSSGSAAAVGSNLVAFSLGNDGGGSIRMPASHCGLTGLKATFGRISLGNESSEITLTVTHSGPICDSVTDTAYIYGVIAGYSEKTMCPVEQPVPRILLPSSKKYKLGLWSEWISQNSEGQAQYDVFRDFVGKLQNEAKNWVEIDQSFRIPELFFSRTAHVMTILAELATRADDQVCNNRDNLCNDTITYCAIAKHCCRASDYINSAKQRTRLMKILDRAFTESGVDAFITPTLGVDIGVRHAQDSKYGNVNNWYTANMMTFCFFGNLAGIPCISVPIGMAKCKQTGKELPVGLQICGRWWDEETILDIGLRLERQFGKIERARDCYFEY